MGKIRIPGLLDIEEPFDVFEDSVGIAYSPQEYTSNGNVQNKNVLGYEFINLGNTPVLINNTIFLDRYYSGVAPNPTYLNSFYRWAPPFKARERDLTIYSFVFQDKVWGTITNERKLLVIRKMFSTPGSKSQR